MNKRELEFRKSLIREMGGRWLVAIHVENHLNPGVPDLSYVMVAPGHETGWLELKATYHSAKGKPLQFAVEPSQHAWMMRYAHRVPTHFLIKVGPAYHLIDGIKHNALVAPITEEDLMRLAIASFTDNTLVSGLSAQLQGLTRRDKNGS